MRHNLLLSSILIFGANALINVLMLFFPLFFISLGMEGWQSGILLSSFLITGILFSVFSGIGNDLLTPPGD